MPDPFPRVSALVPSLRQHLPADLAALPLVILLHGLGGDRDDWMNPIQERNWPYDSSQVPATRPLPGRPSQPLSKLLGLKLADFLSPQLTPNSNGVDGSDDRSWWHALAGAGFPVLTYSQMSGLLLPCSQGPVAEFAGLMEALQQDMQENQALATHPVVLVGHSRGGLIARAYLGDAQVKSDVSARFPRVAGLITLSSPHAGSRVALLDDRIIAALERVQEWVPQLPYDLADRFLNAVKARVAAFGSPEVDEIQPGSALYRALEGQDPVAAGMRCISVGGTSPRFLRVYRWKVALEALVFTMGPAGMQLSWQAKPVEAKLISPILDGGWLRTLGVKLHEITRGLGDGLTTDASCRLPTSFQEEEHLSFAVNHGEELWSAELQRAIIARLETF